ncbi:MAG: hypothetical protein ACRDO2_11005 [Nocardioidaceae bacterium]
MIWMLEWPKISHDRHRHARLQQRRRGDVTKVVDAARRQAEDTLR